MINHKIQNFIQIALFSKSSMELFLNGIKVEGLKLLDMSTFQYFNF
jgi:hypothetical protein